MRIASTTKALAALALVALVPGCGAGDEAACELADGGCEGTCPPVEPFGVFIGDSVQDLSLKDCDGNVHDLHALCEEKTTWIFLYTGW